MADSGAVLSTGARSIRRTAEAHEFVDAPAVVDFRNGNTSFPESDELMRSLLESYSEVPDYHDDGATLPFMVPTPVWVKPNGNVTVFPGGPGTSPGATRFPYRGILVMAHDYDSVASYEAAVARGYSKAEDAAFGTLCRMLRESTNNNFDFRECFFTNRYMGVRKVQLDESGNEPKGSQNGPNPSRKHKPYRQMCIEMLDRTIAAVRPSIVITLGAPAASTIGYGRQHWRQRGIRDVLIRNHRTKLACLTHTGVAKSLYDTNVKKVEYRAVDGQLYVGIEAEMALMRDAWAEYKRIRAGLPPESLSLS